MKKKILSILTTIFGVCLCVFTFTACGENEPPHTHNYATLKYNNENHWFECECEEKNNVVAHNIVNGQCVCGYIVAHTHVYDQQVVNDIFKTSDATCEDKAVYYFSCTCGDKGTETFENGSSLGHSYGDWVSIGNSQHKKTCVNDNAHVITENCFGGTATCTELAKCLVCNTEYGILKEHNYTELKKDETGHWNECACGDKTGFENHMPGAPATETTDQKCTECNYVITPALGHIHTLHLTKVDSKAQSCTEEGNIEYYTCDCGKWFTDNTAVTEITDKASVVISKDVHNYNTLKHNETEHWNECSCGDKDNIEAHKGGTATCEDKPLCSICNVEYGSANGHTEGAWITDIQPTCTEAGSKHQVCSVCSDTIKTATIAAKHLINATPHPTTCSGSGYDEYKCERCEYSRTENWEQMYCTVSLSSTGNNYYTLTVNIYGGASEYSDVDANIAIFATYSSVSSVIYNSSNESYDGSWSVSESEDPYYGVPRKIYIYIKLTTGEGFICDYFISSSTYSYYERYTVPHKYESVVTAPTCEEQGYTTHTCSVCGDNYKDTYVSVPHTYESVVTAPTCDEQGFTTHTCSVCGESYEDTYVGVVGHDFQESNSCNDCGIDIANVTIDSYTMSATSNDNVKGYVVSRADGNYDVYIKGSGSMKGYTSSPFVVDGYRIINAYIENGVTNIGTNVFSNCRSLEIIAMPDSITSIGACAFSDCASLKGVTIPAGVVNINSDAFRNCHSLKEIYFNATAMDDLTSYIFYNTGTSGVKVVIGANVTKIPGSLFRVPFVPAIYSPKITSLEFEVGSVCQSIGEMAFTLCSLPVNITLPEGLTSIGNSAFYKCTDLTSVTIPSSVISIGNSAFEACNNLASITIPSSVIKIGDSAFSSCSNLAFIAIEGLPYIGPNAFADTTYYNSTSNWQNKILYIDNCLIAAKITVETCIIKEDTTVIAGEAFSNCTSLINITIPDSVTSIGNSAFYNCSSLTIVVIGDGVTSIANEVFYGCSSLISITIPDSVTSIGEYAFYRCNNLMTVVIPNSVTSIGFVSFHECSNLANVYYKGTESDWAKISFDWNPTLKSAPCYYYSESEPTTSGNYWHYDENSDIAIW